ncbi:hypothetical protein [Kitasatospora sp. NPDC047058]|uniref:hypothetical protein n=1 Tax=Kitasatospora sp. NPDC047058 TaxID=3155620 RepID=UPI0033CF5F2A
MAQLQGVGGGEVECEPCSANGGLQPPAVERIVHRVDRLPGRKAPHPQVTLRQEEPHLWFNQFTARLGPLGRWDVREARQVEAQSRRRPGPAEVDRPQWRAFPW